MASKLLNYVWPREENKYSPLMTRSSSIFIFAIFVFVFNFVFGQVKFAKGGSSINANELVVLHNKERAAAGLSNLSVNTLLNKSAQAKAEAMLKADCWSHYCPDGKSPWDFFDEAGYVYMYAGENLAQGFYDEESVMQAWMNSPTHKANVLKAEFTEIGIGIAYGKFQGVEDNIVIAVHFGSRYSSNNITPTPTNTIDTGVMNKPVVNYPEEGAILNDNMTEVIGESQNASYVEVNQDGENIGKLDVEGGLFTYRPANPYKDGLHTFVFTALTENMVEGESSEARHFRIDTQKPSILESAISAKAVVKGDQSLITLDFSANEPLSAARMEKEEHSYLFTEVTSLNWEVDIEKSVLESGGELKITLIDLAGNEEYISLPVSGILGLNKALEESDEIILNSSAINPVISIFDKFVHNNRNVQLNLIFIVFAILILAIDFIALKKTGLTSFQGKPHLHFTSIFILIVIIIIGGAGGTILTGMSI